MNGLDQRRRTLAIGLAGLAGFVDAVGFLSADGYFVSFMSGNTTRLGVDLGHAPARAVVPALLLAGFVGGVALGAVIAARAGALRKRAVLGLVAGLLLLAAALQGRAPAGLPLALLVMAMGALNNTFLRDGEVTLGLTYMTGALVKLGQVLAARLLGQPRADGVLHGVLWSGLALGGLLGALAFARVGGPALWLAGGWALLMLALAWRLES